MKKLWRILPLLALFAAALAFPLGPVEQVSAFAGGTGASGSPYQISTCAELLKIDDTTANLSKAYLLTGNIDCTGVTVSPMVNGSTYFTGTLDGGGFEIKGLSLSCSTVYCGLFHTVTSGTVKNIVFDAPVVASTSSYVGVVAGSVGARTATAIFEDVVIRSMNVDASGVVGGFAGICTACSVAGGSVSGSVDADLDKVGGLFGLVGEASYSHLFSVGDVSTSADVSGRDYVGGIVGQAYRATYTSTAGVFQTTVSPTVSVTGRDYVGGVVGHTSYTGGFNFEDIGSHATVSGEQFVGGIIGWSRGSSERVYRSYSTGDLSQTKSACSSGVGGITASNDSDGYLRIIESYSTSSITGACRFGGLVGNASTNRCEITDSFFRGSLTRAAGSTDSVIGGITGRGCTSITRGYAATNALQAFGGGVSNDVSVAPVCTDVYWDTESSGRSSTRCTATGKTSAQMKTQATFTNFDFASMWIIDPDINGGYPYLRNLAAPGSDVTPPTVSWTEPSTPTSSLTFTYSLTFSEAVSGILASDFSSTGTATGCVFTPSAAVANPSVSVSVTCTGNGSFVAQLKAGMVSDAAGNTGPASLAAATSVTVAADVIAPTASWTEPTTPSSSRTLSYTLTFSESVTGIAAGDFSFTGTATGCAAAPAASTANLAVSISVTCASDGTVIMRLSSNSVTDGSSNTGPPAAVTAATVTINAVVATTLSPTTVAPTQTAAPSGTVAPTTTTVAQRAQGGVVAAQVTTTTVASTSTSSTTSTLPVAEVPPVADGGGALLIDGKRVEAAITRDNNQLIVTAGAIRARISAVKREGGRAPLDSDGRLRMNTGDSIEIEVFGFASKSEVEVRMYSNPVLLGRTGVGADGTLLASYEVPETVDNGRHTVVLLGQSSRGEDLTFALAVAIGDESSGPSLFVLLVLIPLGLAVLVGLVLPAVLRRRRKDEEEDK